MTRLLISIACIVGFVACSEKEAVEAAPHEPELPTPILADGVEPPAEDTEPEADEPDEPAEEAAEEAVADEPEPEPEKAPAKTSQKSAAKDSSSSAKTSQTSSAPKTGTTTAAKPTPEPEKTADPAPEPEKTTTPATPAAPTTKTRIPSTDNLRVTVPAKLQKHLDADPRMQSWINKVMGVANQCYAQVRSKNASAGGTISVLLTMHENSRPSPDIKQLPPALSGMVTCATGRLFSVKMPLFTGPEGEKHTVKLVFTP